MNYKMNSTDVMLAMLYPIIHTSKTRESNIELRNAERLAQIEPEYRLVMRKKSKLPKSKRDSIVRQYNRLQSAINRGES